MPTNPKILDPTILDPISPLQPAGIDLDPSQEAADLRALRQDALKAGPETAAQLWRQLRDNGVSVLRSNTKDLRVARIVLEALIHTNSFDGVHDGIWLFHQLLVRFWDLGLYPLIENTDRTNRSVPLNWLDKKLADEIKALPLTKAGGAEEYSRLHFEFAQNPDYQSRLTLAQFSDAMKATPPEHLEELGKSINDTLERLQELNQLSMERFGPDVLSYGSSIQALKDCQKLIELHRTGSQGTNEATSVSDGQAVIAETGPITSLFELSEATAGSWQKAEEMIRSGQIEPGIREMARIAATESNGRARFFRKLLLADACMRTRRDILAVKILEELTEQIELYKLVQWETSEVVGAVWTRLYQLYAKRSSNTANSEAAAKLYHNLSRLDPWQAINL